MGSSISKSSAASQNFTHFMREVKFTGLVRNAFKKLFNLGSEMKRVHHKFVDLDITQKPQGVSSNRNIEKWNRRFR
ncbi:hypothetical protein D3C87_2069330 [compost metagenome]